MGSMQSFAQFWLSFEQRGSSEIKTKRDGFDRFKMPYSVHQSRVHGTAWPGVFATDIESTRHFERHSHDCFGFGYLHEGAQRWLSGRGTVRGYPGQIISTNPGEVHDGAPFGGPSRRWRIIHVDSDAMADLTGSDANSMIEHPVIDDPELLRKLSRAFTRIASRDDRLACEEALVDCCVSLMNRHGSVREQPPRTSATLTKVRERLADHALPAPSLDELAIMTGLSRYQVLRRFESAYGLSPHAWLLQLRVERARTLIQRGETLARAAATAGFADQSHMHRAFVRQLGFTPGSYRKALMQ